MRRSGRAPIAGQQEDLKLLSRWFEKKEVSVPSASLTGIYGPKVLRHSGGFFLFFVQLRARYRDGCQNRRENEGDDLANWHLPGMGVRDQ